MEVGIGSAGALASRAATDCNTAGLFFLVPEFRYVEWVLQKVLESFNSTEIVNPVVKYFNGERLQCSIGVIVSLLSIAIALYFLFNLKKPFYSGISYPFLVIPFLLLVICIAVIIRSPRDIQRVNDMLDNNHEKIKTEELPRMDKVMKSFTLLKWIEVGAALTGIVLCFIMPAGSFWKGIGIGLSIQSSLMFLFDFIAASRGKAYWDFLRSLSN